MGGALGALDKIERETTERLRERLLRGECIVCGTEACGGACIPMGAVLDLFAGPGGWDVAGQWLGLGDDLVGVELDAAAVLTRNANGHKTIHASVTAVPLSLLAQRGVRGLIASPPCQTFSQAGSGSGRKQLDLVVRAVQRLGAGEWPQEEIDATHDPRTALVLEPLRWALALEPEWLAFEQVPGVLPVWEAMAAVLREHGWFVTTGVVHAEQYGVPQTRKRAVLLGHRRRPVSLPTPTHSKYHTRSPGRLDQGVQPWVSTAQALTWGMSDRPSYTIVSAKTGSGTNGSEWGGSGTRKALAEAKQRDGWVPEGAAAMGDVRNSNGCVRPVGAPAPTMSASMDNGNFQWVMRSNYGSGGDSEARGERTADQPAATVTSKAGRNKWVPRHNGSTKSRNDGVRVTVQQAGIIQTFPADYCWQGTVSKQYEQVGNAVPPVLAAALLGEVALD